MGRLDGADQARHRDRADVGAPAGCHRDGRDAADGARLALDDAGGEAGGVAVEAEFLAGGQVPIPLITNNQFTVEFKPYGVILNLRPTADRNGNIQTEIEAESSELDTSVAVSIGGSATVPG